MQSLISICNYLHLGLKFLVPLLFILRIDKLKPRFLNAAALVKAFNVTLLLAAMAFIAGYFVDFFAAYFSGVEYNQYAFINRATGPYWFGFWIPTAIYILLPQLIWFKKIRKSVWITYTWFIMAIALSLFINFVSGSVWFSPTLTLSYYILSIVITVALLAIFYFISLKILT